MQSSLTKKIKDYYHGYNSFKTGRYKFLSTCFLKIRKQYANTELRENRFLKI